MSPPLALPKGSLVVVSGATGNIASHIIDQLLAQGYRVRGTVRAQSKVAHLKDTFKEYGDKLEVVVVPDITKVSPTC